MQWPRKSDNAEKTAMLAHGRAGHSVCIRQGDLSRVGQTEKDEPQPQVVVALGLLTTKREPISPCS